MEVLLLAARALSSIMELFPGTAIPKAIAEHVVPSLCEKLMEIEYMDVAELALQILERIVCKSEAALALTDATALAPAELSAQYRSAVIQENGIVALLQYVDFFPLEIQRTAAHVVCQLCTDFPLAMSDKLEVGLPLVSNLLSSYDTEILQSGCEALRKLSESKAFAESPQFAWMVASDAVCESLVQKLAAYGNAAGANDSALLLTPAGYTNILRFMSCVLSCVGSDLATYSAADSASSLRFVRLPPIVSALLAKEEVMNENQLLRETLKLVIAVLPITEEVQSVEALPQPMLCFAQEILPLVTRVYNATSRRDLRYDCLGVIYRSCSIIFAKRTPISAEEQAEMTSLAAFLTRVLRPKRRSIGGAAQVHTRRDGDVLSIRLALQIIEVTLGRVDGRALVKSLYIRHGVPSAIQYYASVQTKDCGARPDDHQREAESDWSAVSSTAFRLVRDYFDASSSGLEVIDELREVVQDLNNLIQYEEKSNRPEFPVKKLRSVLHRLSVLFTDGGGLTAHEIARSGLVNVLINILSIPEGKAGFTLAISDDPQFGVFEDVASFIEPLVQSLQDAVSSEKDAFSLESSSRSSSAAPVPSGVSFSSGNVSSDLNQLTQHIKVRVMVDDANEVEAEKREGGSGSNRRDDALPTPWSFKNSLRRSSSRSLGGNGSRRLNRKGVHDSVVLVEPLARIETMEEFVAEKLFGTQSSSTSILDELAGRDRSDDEGEEKEDDAPTEHARERRVKAVYNDHILPPDISILEAIVKFGVMTRGDDGIDGHPSLSGRTSSVRSRVWASTAHEISFRITPKSEVEDDDKHLDGDVEVEAVKSEKAVNEPRDVDGLWWDNVWDLLQLLKLIRDCVGVQHGSQSPVSDPAVFVNSYLSLQVNRALQQPIRVVTNALPAWCDRVVREFSFALEFETRYHFVYVTTCGTSRAIQYLCRTVWKQAVMEEPSGSVASQGSSGRRRGRDGSSARSRTSGLTNIARMVKLPRLKVRVARSRLLQSAKKLLTIYGGKKAVIEIEFLGEVGTGLGPTTEFFTLVCEEIQSKRLQMWRDDDPDNTADSETKSNNSASDVSNDQDRTAKGSGSVSRSSSQKSLPVRGYHRVAVYHCPACKRVHVPSCSIHQQLLTFEKKVSRDDSDCSFDGDDAASLVSSSSKSESEQGDSTTTATPRSEWRSIPQCAACLDEHDWSLAEGAMCACQTSGEQNKPNEPGATYVDDLAELSDADKSAVKQSALDMTQQLRWWILSDEESHYLGKVYPRDRDEVTHPVLQCAHCETVNFPGTDAGIVEMDGERMLARSGRRMYERDYRAVTKHVSPLCEGTPLKVLTSVLTRRNVELLVDALPRSPEVLESEVEALSFLSESSLLNQEIGGGPAVVAPFGLFPRPYWSTTAPEDETKAALAQSPMASLSEAARDKDDVLSWFTFLGRFVGQAILDERLLNLPLARPFLRALRGEALVGVGVPVETSLAFLAELDPSVATSLRYLHRLASRYESAVADGGEKHGDEIAQWRHEVEDMCLSFTLVGDAHVSLLPNGADVSVTLETLREYVSKSLEFLLDTTIRRPVLSFRRGFEQICGGHTNLLDVFDASELEALVADAGAQDGSMWGRDGQELREHMVCDHGYTRESRAIGDLVAILCELSATEQRLFVRFVTGANRLPRGGLAKLEPKLTVVRKLAEAGAAGADGDAVLPSASTCTNYLKLPDYSTRETMRARLLYCIHEGQGSFHLS